MQSGTLLRRLAIWLLIGIAATAPTRAAFAASGPFGIDHRIAYDNSGVWARHNQKVLMGATIVTVAGGSLALGDRSKLGDTFWRALDSMAVSSAVSQAAKWTFQRERPSQTPNPDEFFKGIRYESFPSGEVTAMAG
ncbi:MAG TPA: phosphatase PAP2 family protein, partial [Rhodanobacteraceae bacterium]|nr:phosphatase PAP2 family protein [Rhodanobacteraceae bacterium]